MGKAKNIKNRVASYFTKNSSLGERTKMLVSKTEKIRFITVGSEIESLLLEANYIKKFSPLYNVRLTDGKAYPLIEITHKDKYPKILISRRSDNPTSKYFGPFPNAGDMRLVLKTIRRIFPFQSVNHHSNKPCLYYHLGLCPCPTVFDSKDTKTNYAKTIKYIISFLNGNVKKIIKGLEKERNEFSKKEDFEKAQDKQKKIYAILQLTNPVRAPFEYDTNPNLRGDIRISELNSLKNYLKKAGVNASKLSRIECFDISNISGKHATGSMVVFTEGEKDSSQYRRFRIRLAGEKPNDFAMMSEVIDRRIRNKQWLYPDLIIVDGGKGQISAATVVLKKHSIPIPIVGLAKREEIIITQDFKQIMLTKDQPALQLMMRIRDEAHRFAITYHRILRSKQFLS